MANANLIFTLFPPPRPEAPIAAKLWDCRMARGLRDWSRPHCWGWLILDGQLEATQKALLALRTNRLARVEA